MIFKKLGSKSDLLREIDHAWKTNLCEFTPPTIRDVISKVSNKEYRTYFGNIFNHSAIC